MYRTQEHPGFDIRTGEFSWIQHPARYASASREFGEYWRMYDDDDTLWTVRWLVDTGELYAVTPYNEQFVLLGYFATAEDVERRMEGWRDCLIKDLTAFFLPPSHPAQKHAKARTEAKLKAWQNAVTINGNGHRN